MLELHYFSAPWCNPCRSFGLIVEKICQQTGTKLVKIDISTSEGEMLALTEGIRGVPTIILSKDGMWQDQKQGVVTESGLRAMIGSVGA